jgi:outer membrane protein OmpA-like peptidoglycan-associated protein
MRSGARFIAMFTIHCLLVLSAFAGDGGKPAANPKENAKADGAASATTPAQDNPQKAPTPTPKAQKADKYTSTSMRGQNTPGGELFLGFSYIWFNTNTGPKPLKTSESFDFLPGGEGSITGNVNNWFGLTAEGSGYELHDVGGVNAQLYTFLFGPKFSARSGRWTPFIHLLAGGARLTTGKPAPGFIGDTAFFAGSRLPFHQNAFAADAGAGLDFNATRHLAIRFIQGDYLYTKFHDLRDNHQNNVRASGGIVWRFGFPAAPPVHHPPTATCSANPTSVQEGSGQTVTVHAEANSPDNNPLTYAWTATGGTVDGTGPDVRWNPGTSAPGTYTVTARVDDGYGGIVSCSANIQVTPKPILPPTMSCSISAQSVPPGQRVQITATASDPQNFPLTYTWQASGGQIVGSGAQVQLDTTGLKPGHYTVNGQVDNGHQKTATCTVELDVQIPPEVKELEQRLSLHSVFFPTAQPTVKNPNGGLLASQQRTLLTVANDFKKYLAYKPEAQLNLTGHADPRGSATYNQALSERRVNRVKSFLVEQGVPADHITVQGLGEEQPLTAAEIRQRAEADQTLTPDQKARIVKNATVVALAQARRVDMTLSTTGQTSERAYPFNAEDVLNLINPRGTAAPAKKAPAKKPTTKKRTAPAPTKK